MRHGAALSWSAPVLVDSSPTGTHQPRESQLACPSAHQCVATGDQQRLFVSRDPAGGSATWRAVLGPRVRQLTCPTPHFCAGVGDDFVAMSTDPAGGPRRWEEAVSRAGGAWATDTPPAIGGPVYCASTRLCLLAAGGVLLTTTDPGARTPAWRRTRLAVRRCRRSAP